MWNFKKQILKKGADTAPLGDCVSLVSFDYKGVGDITFNFTNCEGDPDSYTFTGLPNTGGTYETWSTDAAIPPMPCYLNGTLTASIVNVNNYVIAECIP